MLFCVQRPMPQLFSAALAESINDASFYISLMSTVDDFTIEMFFLCFLFGRESGAIMFVEGNSSTISCSLGKQYEPVFHLYLFDVYGRWLCHEKVFLEEQVAPFCLQRPMPQLFSAALVEGINDSSIYISLMSTVDGFTTEMFFLCFLFGRESGAITFVVGSSLTISCSLGKQYKTVLHLSFFDVYGRWLCQQKILLEEQVVPFCLQRPLPQLFPAAWQAA